MLHIFLLEKQVLAKVFKTQDKSRIFYVWKDSWILRDAMQLRCNWLLTPVGACWRELCLRSTQKTASRQEMMKTQILSSLSTWSVPRSPNSLVIFFYSSKAFSSLFGTHIARKDSGSCFLHIQYSATCVT